MGEHVKVHGRRYNDRASAAQVHSKQKTIACALHHAAQGLGRCWCDEEGVGPQAELDMVGPGALIHAFCKVAVHPVIGQRGEGKGGDEFRRRFGHDYANFCPAALELTGEYRGFEGSDAACNA